MKLSEIASPEVRPRPAGSSEFLTRAERARRSQELSEQGYLVARVVQPLDRAGHGDGPAQSLAATASSRGLVRRGRLRETVEGAVELALARRGATPADDDDRVDPAALARDQLDRALALGATGLCVVLPELRPIADSRGVLDEADGAVLRAWAELCTDRPVVLLFDGLDADVRALAPVSLARLLGMAEAQEPEWRTAEDDEATLGAPAPVTRSLTPAPEAGPRLPPVALSAKPVAPPSRPPTSPTPERPGDGRHARELARELDRARGPQPPRVVEQLFRSSYAPLVEKLSAGLDDELVRQAVTTWRRAFEKSYADSYTAMRLTGKRPPMVLDAPEMAVKLARLNGARASELLLVDGMRFDLGERITRATKARLAARALLVDETLLWSALPTTTPTQLHLLGTGPRGLREPEPPSERDTTVQRGRSVTTLRRVRIGSRDLVKLDVVEARLRDAGPDFETRTTALAEEVADVIARFVASLQARTLLLVFGDHGFRLTSSTDERRGGLPATLPATQGGASPEEVLVPAYAWLIGAVH